MTAEFGTAEYDRALAARLAREADDVVAAVDWLGARPEVAADRIGVIGSSFGGAVSLLAAARCPGLRCAVDFAGAAMNWERTPTLRATMLEAARQLAMPIAPRPVGERLQHGADAGACRRAPATGQASRGARVPVVRTHGRRGASLLPERRADLGPLGAGVPGSLAQGEVTTMRGAFLEDLTWPEAGARIAAGAVVVVPVGAAAKEHGPHLPLRTDYLVARELGRRVAEVLPVLVAPVVSFGYYPAFVRYPGSQHLRAETFMALLTDILTGFVGQGARRLAVINTGVSTEAPLRVVVRDFYATHGRAGRGRRPGHARARRSSPGSRQKLGGHADELETSLVLAIEPGAVRMERAEPDYGHLADAPANVFYQPVVFDADPGSGPDWSRTGARGDPSLATRETGEAALREITRALVDGLVALYPDLR